VERYDVASDTWTAVADMHERRHYSTAVTAASTDQAKEKDLFDALVAKASMGHP
jgi:hypothetical protein